VGVLVALTVGLVFWITAWAFGMKSFDAFMVTMALVMAAVVGRLAGPFVKQLTGRETASPSEQGVAERIAP
jgi:hypothetical protein